MMMVQSSVNAGLSSVPNHEKQESSCVWIPGDWSWQKPTHHKTKDDSIWIPGEGSWQKPTHQKTKDDSICSLNFLSSSQLSTEVYMSENSTPNIVYKRRTIHKNANVLPSNPNSTTTIVYKRKQVQTESKSGSVDRDEIMEDPKNKKQKLNLRVVNESCSSSKSNVDIGPTILKEQVDDAAECSSSCVSETNSCMVFLRQHGVLERIIATRSKKPTGAKKDVSCLRSCKVCERLKTTLKMLICDLCEESFHMSCCSHPVRKVPVGDWSCHSCSRKKLKKLKETTSGKESEDYVGPIASMLRDADHYTSHAHVGEDFQVEVQDWSGPLTDQLNDCAEPAEISPLECASFQDWGCSKLSRLGSIGNWLQCRQIVDDVVGTVCGKWRRAPLFEVQTENWECFCSVHWDPTRADCAVSQELDTDQILKQLKYIEMLRPCLSAKKWKLGVMKKVVQREQSGDPRNTQNS